MKFMQPEKRLAKLFLSFGLVVFFLSPVIAGQTKKPAAKPPAKPPAKAASSTKPSPKAAKPAANTKSTTPKTNQAQANTRTAANKKAPANQQLAQTRNQRQTNTRSTPANARQTPAQRRREAERRKQEEARRLAEQRRREQAAREARARKLAFERGLKTETAGNIANDNTDGEDLRIREVAVNALGERAGTVVVMDAQSGRILTMVNQEWGIKHGFKPCSTIKLVTGVAGLQENLITPDGSLVGDGMSMNLDDALAHSNNVYFQRVGANLGNEKMIDYSRRLGLGQKTGVNAEGETPGRLPFGNNNPRIYSHADDFEVTPLQLAVMVTAIANGGKRITPHFQRTRKGGTATIPSIRDEVGLPDPNVQGVIPGMIGAAEYGTARRGLDQSMGVAGKTGSCIGRGSWVGLFASVAPIEDPKYSVVVITRGESERGRIAAGIAARIYESLRGDLRRDNDRFTALRKNRMMPDAQRMLAANIADEDEEDDAATEGDEVIVEERQRVVTSATGPVPTPSQQQTTRPAVQRTTQSSPVFAPVVIEYDKREQPAARPGNQDLQNNDRPAPKSASPAPAAKPKVVVQNSSAPTRPAAKPAQKPAQNTRNNNSERKPAAPARNTTNQSKPAATNRTNQNLKKPAANSANTTQKKPAAQTNSNQKKPASSNSNNNQKKPANSAQNSSNQKKPAANSNNSKPAAKPPAKPAASTAKAVPANEKQRPRVVRNK